MNFLYGFFDTDEGQDFDHDRVLLEKVAQDLTLTPIELSNIVAAALSFDWLG